ncbi:reverse transcriptase domain-containing protein [Ruminiclostridium josui]|uniref:reverse transcriptase domain-containing protein n=1 Tax=Ruminiclostridium josui TaxID=1499 RepID=UPI0004664396|nr:reverse transcriptase domain-containing protein [Ruminiclostridium josui]
MTKPTSDILERIYKNSSEHKDGVYTRLYRYLLRDDIYYLAYQKLYSNKGASTKGIDNDTADGFGKKYVDSLIKELSDGTYTPKPVRREYIKKKNGKMRPLGIPSFRDKLLQEVIRNFLEAIYEPTFSDFSHGFRPKRSCHTALEQAKLYFRGAKWFIEGDIKGCFDDIDHDKLIEILQRKIKDSRFINVIRSFLKAGYMEDWKYHQTYSGCPQGGILSPILANIYLNELDNEIAKIKQAFDKPATRKITPEHSSLSAKLFKRRKKLKSATGEQRTALLSEIHDLEEQYRKTPSKMQDDKKVSYVRYADDFLIAENGSKEDCVRLKEQLAKFLFDEYKLTLSKDKTLITHSSERVRFLGYDISVRRNQEYMTDSRGRKARHLNNTVALSVPFEKIEKHMFEKGFVRQTEAKKFRPLHKKGWLYLPDAEIVERYNAEIRGIVNYYYLASNLYKLQYFAYLMEYSCLATLAGKHNSTIKKIVAKHKQGKDWAIKYKTENGATKEKRIVKLKDCKGKCEDKIVQHRYSVNTNATIRARLQAGICELCGSKDKASYEVHHVPSVKGLDGTSLWEQIMKSKRRKTLVVCEDCHKAIHDD